MPHPTHVLFLCTGNSARSQIAEALLARKGGDRFVVASAGTEPASEVRPEAVEVLRDAGIDWTGKRPKSIDALKTSRWDIVITLCDRAKESCPTLPNQAATAHWGVPDPAAVADRGRREQAFRSTVDLLSWRIDLMLALRPESLDKLVLESRLRDIASESVRPAAPGSKTTTRT